MGEFQNIDVSFFVVIMIPPDIYRRYSAFKRAIPLLLTALLLLPIHPLVAQRTNVIPLTQYNLRSWSTNEGLPNDKIMAVYQSSQGYIWLASQEGLVRFDGVHFDIFDKQNTPAFPHSQITSLIEDKDSTLWIGTIRGVLQYRRGVFKTVPVDTGVGSYICNTLYIDREGNCLVGTRNGVLRIKDGVVSKSGLPDAPTVSVSSIYEDKEGQLWIGTGIGFCLMRGAELIANVGQGIPAGAVITALGVDNDQTMWVGTTEGLYVSVSSARSRFEKVKGLSNQIIRSLCVDRNGHLWIGTEQSGLYRYAEHRLEQITTRQGLSADYVLSLCEDKEGNIWAGTFFNGVNEIWRGKFETYSTVSGIAGPLVRAMTEAPDGTVWIGTESGLSRWKSGSVVSYTTKNGLPHDQIRSVFLDRQGDVWLGTRSGLSRFDGKHFKNYFERDGLSNDYARVVTEDFDGNIWIGYAARGIDRFRNGKFQNLSGEGIPPISIRVIYRGRDRTMWIGTDNGLVRWKDGKAKLYREESGLPRDLFALYEDTERTVWIGTYGDGLFRLKDEKVSRITSADGLFDDVVYQILEDDQQNFWMSSNKGIFRVARSQLNDVADKKIVRVNSVSYGTADGMRSSECNGNSQPAGIRTKDGRMWFPTTNGVAIINPSDIPKNSVPPEVTVESLKVDSLSINLEHHVSIDPGYSYLEFHYTGLSFVVPEKMIFKYKLEGFDKEWRNAGSRRVAYYTNVPPGHYTFRVQARNNDEVWSKEGVALAIELRPYFYETAWFYVLSGFVLIGLIFGIYRWRVAFLLQQEKELKQRVDESIAQIKILGGLIPICSNCKKIRDDKGYWNQLEKYLKEHSEAEFTHGICPECREKLYGAYLKKKETGPNTKPA